MSVPRFGGWAQKTGTPDYSMVFSRARADKRQRHKIRLNRIDLENESEHIQVQQHEDDGSVKVYFFSIGCFVITIKLPSLLTLLVEFQIKINICFFSIWTSKWKEKKKKKEKASVDAYDFYS